MTLSDQMVVMRDGEIAQVGEPADIYENPASTFVAGFVGSPKMNLIDGEVVEGCLHTRAGARLALPGAAPGSATIGIRPEDIALEHTSRTNGRHDDTGRATVELTELVGPRVIVSLRFGDQRIKAVMDTSEANGVAAGSSVTVGVRAGTHHRFDPDTGDRVGPW